MIEISHEEEQTCPKLKVVFGGMDGRFSTVPLRYLAAKHELVGIVHSTPRRVKRGFVIDYARAGQGAGNLERFARYYGCQYLSIGNSYGVELVQFLEYLKPDVFCLSNFSVILPPTIYEIPKYGTLNLHLSKLPQFRGPMPWLWMFHEGVGHSACTVYRLDDGEDSGPIIFQEDFAVPPNVTCSELADTVLPQGANLLVKAVNALALGKAEFQEQPSKEGTIRARYLRPHENLIDWNEWGCERVGSFLRGASNWYDAFAPIPGFYREYLPGELGPCPGKVGTAVWRGRRGWIVCKDGRVPFILRPNWYELGRLGWPPAILLALFLLL